MCLVYKQNSVKSIPNPPKANTVQKTKFSVKDFFSKSDQIRRKLRSWSHLLKKSLMKHFIFYAVIIKQLCSVLIMNAE